MYEALPHFLEARQCREVHYPTPEGEVDGLGSVHSHGHIGSPTGDGCLQEHAHAHQLEVYRDPVRGVKSFSIRRLRTCAWSRPQPTQTVRGSASPA